MTSLNTSDLYVKDQECPWVTGPTPEVDVPEAVSIVTLYIVLTESSQSISMWVRQSICTRYLVIPRIPHYTVQHLPALCIYMHYRRHGGPIVPVVIYGVICGLIAHLSYAQLQAAYT